MTDLVVIGVHNDLKADEVLRHDKQATRRAALDAAKRESVMTRLGAIAIALVCLVSAGLAGAQDAPAPTIPAIPAIPELSPDLQQRFKQADLTGKGGLTQGEAASAGFAFGDAFDSIDTDHDHIITLYEISVYVAARARDWASADTNGDGVVTREEAEKVPSLAKVFSKADRDGDGVVRKEEYEAFSERALYQNVDLPYVVPNIINKKF